MLNLNTIAHNYDLYKIYKVAKPIEWCKLCLSNLFLPRDITLSK